MSLGHDRGDGVPPTNKALLVAAGVCLLIPLVGLMWVGSYTRETPRLWGFPFFFWYQFLWVLICSVLTYSAHLLVLAARRGGDRDGDGEDAGRQDTGR
jgi:membrane protein implicated in regulation of membrane protease activity